MQEKDGITHRPNKEKHFALNHDVVQANFIINCNEDFR